jgi:hypothetical protein
LFVVVALAGVLAGASPGEANLSGSGFEGNDGNLVVNTSGNSDWANVAGLNKGLDDPSGSSDNSFGQGTKEDDPMATVVTGSIPPNKSDLSRFYEASAIVGTDNLLYLAWERTNVLGSANMDFEINQKTTAGFDGSTVGDVTLNRTPGDLLVTYDFGGSGAPAFGLLTWVTSGATSQCFAANALPCWGNRVQLNSTNSEGAVSTTTVTDPIAPDAPRSLPANTFGETAINLTKAGVFPAGTCKAFGSAFLKSRSSASFPAEVKDFIAPIPVNIRNCGSITIRKVTVNDPGTTSFSYSTTGGLTPSTFSLTGGARRDYNDVAAGGYSVTEGALSAGWSLASLTCTASGTGTTASTSGATATITMKPGGAVDCTYTNRFKNRPTVSTVQHLIPNDDFILSGATSNAGGTITFSLYPPSAGTGCSGAPVLTQTVNVSGNGTYKTTNTTFVASAVGTWRWKSSYSGDANNFSAQSACGVERFTIANT